MHRAKENVAVIINNFNRSGVLPDYIEKEKSSMEKVNFGVTKRGEEASLYVLENKNNTTIKVTDYGATLVSLLFADKAGVQKDLVLGYDNVKIGRAHV